MKKYEITITEMNVCKVTVEAETLEQAREIAEKEYWKNPNGYIFDCYDTSFE